MSLVTLILALAMIAVIVYAVRLALAGSWKELIYLAVGVLAAIWILSILGIAVPSLPVIR